MKVELKAYPAYKPSGVEWIGDVPQPWAVQKLKTTSRIVDCKNRTPEVLDDGQYAVIRTSNVRDGKLVFANLHRTDEANFLIWTQRGVPPPGSVLFTREAPAGEVCLVPPELDLCLGQRMMNIIPKDPIFSKFLLYYFQSLGVKQCIAATGDGSTVSHLRVGQVYDFQTVLPTLDAQRAIVAFLDRDTAKIDRLMEVRRKQVERLQEQRAAVIHHAVTKGLDPHAEMKPSGHPWLEEIPTHWTTCRLKFISTLNPSKSTSGYFPTDVEKVVFLPMECVTADGKVDQTNRGRVCDLWKGFTYFAKGDVVVAKITPCFENGKGALVSDLETEIGFGTTEFHVIRASSKLVGEFLYLITASHWFRGIGERFMSGAAGQQRIPQQFIADFSIALPPLQEQGAIVEHVRRETAKLDTLITKYRRELELLAEYRASLISHAVTGKIDVRGIVSAEEEAEAA